MSYGSQRSMKITPPLQGRDYLTTLSLGERARVRGGFSSQ